MTLASLNTAANDPDLRVRVDAAANKLARTDPAYTDTDYGRQLLSPSGVPTVPPVAPTALMWGVAIVTEEAYLAALLAGNGSPGHDEAVIADSVIIEAVQNSWPPDAGAPVGS